MTWLTWWRKLSQATLTSSVAPTKRRHKKQWTRLSLERLEDRTLPAVNWITAGAGNWAVASNWFDDVLLTNHVPLAGDDVVIANGAAVTHNADAIAGGDVMKSLTVNGGSSLILSGGSIGGTAVENVAVNDSGGSFQLFGGTLTRATVGGTSTITATTSGGTLNGVILNGVLDVTTANGAFVSVTGGMTLGGAMLIGSNTGNRGTVSFRGGNQTLDGSGTAVFGTSFINTLWTGEAAGTSLTIGPNILIHGHSGFIGPNTNFLGGFSDGIVINQGTINADVSGGAITVNGTNWSNTGVSPKGIQAVAGATLTLAGSWSNSGTISAAAGSTLNLGGAFATANLGAINSAGATVNLSGVLTNTANNLTLNDTTGSWRLLGGTIDGGTVTTTGTNALVGTTTGGLLSNGVTLNGTLDLTAFNGAGVSVTGGMTLGGAMLIGSNAGNRGTVSFRGGNQTLNGSGTAVFGTSVANTLWTGEASGTNLTIGPNILIHGHSGFVGPNTNFLGGFGDGSVINQGTINADVSGGAITVNGTNWSNTGVSPRGLQAIAGATLTLAGSWSNGGTISAAAGSTLNLSGAFATANLGTTNTAGATVNLSGVLTNTANNLTLNDTTGSWRLLGGTINGGTVTTTGTHALVGTTSGGLLSNAVTLNGTLDVTTNGAVVSVTGGMTLGGAMLIGSNTGNRGTVSFRGGNQTLDGSGTAVFGTSVANTLWTGEAAGTSLTIGPNILIHGQSGFVGPNLNFLGGFSDGTVINQGTINADVSGGSITVNGINWSNTGVSPKGIQAVAGATMTLAGSWSNSGTIAAAAAATLNLGGTFSVAGVGAISSVGATVNLTGVLTNAGTLTLDGPWRLLGGTIIGGTLATTGSGALVGTTSGGLLSNGVTFNGTLDVTTNGAVVSVIGGMTLGGTMLIGSNTGNRGVVSFRGGIQTLDGTGTAIFGTSIANTLWTGEVSGTNLTIGPNILVHGHSGFVGPNPSFLGGFGDGAVINQGTINADVSGGAIVVNGTNWSNTAIAPKGIQVANGATVTLAGSWTNSGAISAAAGSTLNLGGTFTVASLGTITSAGATVNLTGTMTNTGNTLTLDGPWFLKGGIIIGGTVAAMGGGVLTATNSGGTLNGVTLDGTGGNNVSPLDMQASAGMFVFVSGGLTLKGAVLRMGNAANTTFGQLFFTGAAQTIDGAAGAGNAGTIVFGANANNGIFLSTGFPVVTFGANLTITGAGGTINTGGFGFDNLGTITADPTAMGLGLASGTITLDGTRWTNHGIIGAQNGGTLLLNGSLWSNSGGTIALNTSNATIILNGTVTTADLGTFTRPGGTGGTIRLSSSLINVGATLHLGAAPFPGSWELSQGRITGGTLSAAAGSALVVVAGGGLFAGNVTLDGTGAGDNPSPLDIQNTSVQVDVSLHNIAADPTGATQTGSTVTITTTTPHGFAVGHNVVISGVNVAGYNGTFAITSVPTPTTFTYTTTPGLAASGGGTARVNALGGLTLKGAVLRLGNAAGTNVGTVTFGGSIPQTIDGVAGSPGTILFGASASNSLGSGASAMTFGPNLTITGASGQINSTGVAFNNLGTITADPAALGLGLATGIITLTGTNWANTGTIQAQNGGTLNAQGTSTNFAVGTLTGGTWKVFANSTLRLINSGITTNAATIVLDGANSNFFRDAGTTDALANFAANAAAGNFTIQNGRSLTTGVPLTNAGNVTVNATGGGSTFTVTGSYTQTGGNTTLTNGGVLASTTNNVVISGGALQGAGSVNGVVTLSSGATLSPGASPGILNTSGLTLNAGSTYVVELNGLNPGSGYDQVNVTGNVNLNGATLSASRLTSFVPAVGTPFTVINVTAGTVSGTFAQGSSIVIGGITFAINYTGGDGNDVVLTPQTPSVFVDDSWAGTSIGADPANDPIGGLVFGYNAFSDVQSALDQAAVNSTVQVFGGTYADAVNVNKALLSIATATNSTTPAETLVTWNGPVTLDADTTFDTISADLLVNGQTGGGSSLGKTGAGKLTLTNANTYAGSTTIHGGTLQIAADNNLGAGGGVSINAGTLQVAGTFSSARTFTLGSPASVIQVDPGQTLTLTTAVGGSGSLTKTGVGTLDLSSLVNSFGGAGQAVNLNAGALRVSADAGLGNSATSLTFNGATLVATGAISTSRNVTLNASGGTVDFPAQWDPKLGIHVT